MLATCPRCGADNATAARFCLKCVTPLDAGDGAPLTDEHTVVHAMTTLGNADVQKGAKPERADQALPDGTLIEGFRIVRQIGEGGFGIVYLAWDPALERPVAIKEYMPSSLALRSGVSLEVSMRSDRQRETFDAGLRSFVNEARLLARFDHPALVKVFRYWEANGTAYMAMPYYEGPTLKAALAQIGITVSEEQLRKWLNPLLDALSVMHREQCYHRDIAPDNILLTAAGPVLLDFGAARHVISDRTQALTTMLKPGFAPIEQYGGTALQGAWTDLYALAAVVHYAIAGRPPLASVSRVVNDTLRPLSQAYGGQYSAGFLRAMDAALAVRPERRPQDVLEFRALIDAYPTQSSPQPSVAEPQVPVPPGGELASLTPREALIEDLPAMPTQVRAAPAERASAQRRPRGIYGLAAAAALAIGGAGWALTVKRANPPAEVRIATPAPPASPASPARPTAPVPELLAPVAPPVAVSPAPASPPQALPAPRPALAVQQRAAASRAAGKSAPAGERADVRSTAVAALESPRAPPKKEVNVPSYTEEARPPRCSDLVLKSSLETLNSEEVAFQKNKCK